MVYKRLRLGDLKPTKMILLLTNHSTRLPKMIVKDVSVKVGKFIFSVDFVVPKTKVMICPRNEILVILGRPFFASSNALTNCRDGKMKLTFWNMTMELNVFSFQTQPMEFDAEHPTLIGLVTFYQGE